MTVWDELKTVLVALNEREPRPLTGYPDPRGDRDRRPPFHLQLAAWAGDTARELHDRFGADVELVVGALAYPPAENGPPPAGWHGSDDHVRDLPAEQFHVELDGPLTVRSGHVAADHRLLVTNLGGEPRTLLTNGRLTATVFEPGTDHAVGGFAGAQTLPLVTFGLPPRGTTPVPLLVGTDSRLPGLGYAVPAGRWDIRTVLRFAGIGSLRTPPLPITVTD